MICTRAQITKASDKIKEIRVITKLPNSEQSYKGKVYKQTQSVNNRKSHYKMKIRKCHLNIMLLQEKFEDIKAVNRRRTDNAITKRKRTKGQTIIHKTSHSYDT